VVTLWITTLMRRFPAPHQTFAVALRTAVPLAEAIAVACCPKPDTAFSGARANRRARARRERALHAFPKNAVKSGLGGAYEPAPQAPAANPRACAERRSGHLHRDSAHRRAARPESCCERRDVYSVVS
jgi:hypothetical protein